jgi:hypothetical protein
MKRITWKTDETKFGEPATRGDVALVAIRLQRLIAFLQDAFREEGHLTADKRAAIYKGLDELGDSLGEFQERLVGEDEE